jgi:putative lipoprotein
MRLLALLPFVASLLACGGNSQDRENHVDSAARGVISGTVTYLPRIPLQNDAEIRVWIEDMGLAGEEGVLAEDVISTEGRQVPIPFIIQYDPYAVSEESRYQLRVEIHSGDGILLWETRDPPAVITRGAPTEDVEVRVERARGGEDAPLDSPVAGG